MATNNWRIAAQLETIEAGCKNRGEMWNEADLAFVIEFDDVTAKELALALGRTEYSIEAVRLALAAGRKVGGGNSRQLPARPLSARVYTFVGDDVPDGW
jgi:hypothetical protein